MIAPRMVEYLGTPPAAATDAILKNSADRAGSDAMMRSRSPADAAPLSARGLAHRLNRRCYGTGAYPLHEPPLRRGMSDPRGRGEPRSVFKVLRRMAPANLLVAGLCLVRFRSFVS